MARLKVRVQIRRAEDGVALDQLGKVAVETQKLMRMLAGEAALDSGAGYWLARNFHESHLTFDLEYIGEADEIQVRKYNQTIMAIDGFRRGAPLNVSPQLVRQYALVADSFEPGESIRFGLFQNGEGSGAPTAPVDWCEISKHESAALLDRIEETVDYHGTVQGIVHSLYKESNPPYFDLRELVGGRLIKCLYTSDQYKQVVNLLSRSDAVVLVSGMTRASRSDRKIEYVRVERMEASKPLSPQRFRRMIGAIPDFTGELSTSDFLARIRGGADG
jgi:hypothetical protein